jgi:hypothetical protein
MKEYFFHNISPCIEPRKETHDEMYGLCPAALLPYPDDEGRRPEALRPTLSGGLLFCENFKLKSSVIKLLSC